MNPALERTGVTGIDFSRDSGQWARRMPAMWTFSDPRAATVALIVEDDVASVGIHTDSVLLGRALSRALGGAERFTFGLCADMRMSPETVRLGHDRENLYAERGQFARFGRMAIGEQEQGPWTSIA